MMMVGNIRKRHRILLGALVGIGLAAVLTMGLHSKVLADGNDWPVVITYVQVADQQSANNEYIVIRNRSVDNVDVTNWCLYYASVSNVTNGSRMVCISPLEPTSKKILPGGGRITFASSQLRESNSAASSDYVFSSTLSSSGGHVRIVNTEGLTVDKVGWGPAVAPEGGRAVPSLVGYYTMQRKVNSETNVYIDTHDNLLDFATYSVVSQSEFGYGNLLE